MMMMMVVITECEADFGMFYLAQCVYLHAVNRINTRRVGQWPVMEKKKYVEPNAQRKQLNVIKCTTAKIYFNINWKLSIGIGQNNCNNNINNINNLNWYGVVWWCARMCIKWNESQPTVTHKHTQTNVESNQVTIDGHFWLW